MSYLNLNNYERTVKSQYIRNNKLGHLLGKSFKETIQHLDEYDFSYYLSEGRSLVNLIDTLENEYGIGIFDELNMDDLVDYFNTRYTVQFQPYIDWVIRKENDPYEKAQKRKEE